MKSSLEQGNTNMNDNRAPELNRDLKYSKPIKSLYNNVNVLTGYEKMYLNTTKTNHQTIHLKLDSAVSTKKKCEIEIFSRYFCKICEEVFDDILQCKKHCEIHWKKCSLCGKTCANDLQLLRHIKMNHEDKNERNKIINKKDLISTDQQQEENDKLCKNIGCGSIPCSVCSQNHSNKEKTVEEFKICKKKQKPFKCTTCSKGFRSKIGLKQHEATHSGIFQYSCDTCGKGFTCKSYLIVHQRVHSSYRAYQCEKCGDRFKAKQSLIDHQNRHEGVKPYVCEICGRAFITKGLADKHKQTHSGKDNREHQCSVCSKKFVSKSYFNIHMKIHSNDRSFICEFCEKAFLTKMDLKIHLTVHTGVKKYVCNICSKPFARRSTLRSHIRSHTGERPYSCEYCDQRFTQFSPMAIHRRLHTGERPYKCETCDDSFISRTALRNHESKHF